MNNKGRSNKSLCEKSMKIVANMVRLSSFSIAKMSLGTAEPPPATKNLAPLNTDRIKVANSPAPSQFPGSRRAQEPNRSSKAVTYLTEPIQENGYMCVIHEEKSIDGKASDYITRVHKKNRYDSSEASTFSPYILPPPPRVLM